MTTTMAMATVTTTATRTERPQSGAVPPKSKTV